MANTEINTGWKISSKKRDWYREKSKVSASRKRLAKQNVASTAKRTHKLDNKANMPILDNLPVDCVSLFSGCGGLDIGFERAGFNHIYAADVLDICAETLSTNRPNWNVKGGEVDGDVRREKWTKIKKHKKNDFLVIHGGPPCQPFSNSGKQKGKEDPRDMVPEFFRAVKEMKPDVFCMENVPALGNKKFEQYLSQQVEKSLGDSYYWCRFYMFAPHFGVPQRRERLFVIGFKNALCLERFKIPTPTHSISNFINDKKNSLKRYLSSYEDNEMETLPKTIGIREAIGLGGGFPDGLAPTFRSGFTGPRNSTSILNGASSQKVFAQLGIWGSGVAASIVEAEAFAPENGHTRLSVQDCSLIQGFPDDWQICGPVYKCIGQIGNSVAPPGSLRSSQSYPISVDAVIKPHTEKVV